MRPKDTALIVPSIREESFERFLREWRPTGLFDRVDLVLVEDNPHQQFSLELYDDVFAFDWEDIDCEKWSWIIPRRSDTVRSYGYWWAYRQGYQYLMTLDDDCYPEKGYEELDVMHKQMLTRTRWFNTLNNVRPRGTPYKNLGKRDVHINHGLWTNVLDYDAPQQLVDPVDEVHTHDNRIVPHDAYFSFCGMNAMWRREAMVLSYHLLMGGSMHLLKVDGVPTFDKFPFDRFGDIWSGVIAKKICDHLGWAVSSGTPYIHHDRASDPFKNLVKEATGIGVNETFWEKIDAVNLPMGANVVDCYKQVALHVRAFGGEYDEYWRRLGDAMMVWAGLFEEK